MPILTWNDTYSVGVKSLDDQHKKLFGLINQLHDAMAAGKGRDVLGTVLDEMVEYTRVHFTTEEKLFEKYGYPGAAAQKKEHAEFVVKAQELQAKFQKGSITLSLEVSSFLRDWLTHHIQVEDKKYSAFLIEKGVK